VHSVDLLFSDWVRSIGTATDAVAELGTLRHGPRRCRRLSIAHKERLTFAWPVIAWWADARAILAGCVQAKLATPTHVPHRCALPLAVASALWQYLRVAAVVCTEMKPTRRGRTF